MYIVSSQPLQEKGSIGAKKLAWANLAVEEILAKPAAYSANAAVIAMVNALIVVVVPQLANATVIPRRALSAVGTDIPSRLGAAAKHAEHMLRLPADETMVLSLVMTEPARVPSVARRTLQLHIALVVLAAQ